MNEIDFDECLKDSPTYRYVFKSIINRIMKYKTIFLLLYLRSQLRQATHNIDLIEDRLEQVDFQ